MFIKKIMEVVSAPENMPAQCVPEQINARMGVNLPDDYYEVINTYGAGTFGEFISLLVPYTDDFEFGLFRFMEQDREEYNENRDMLFGDEPLFEISNDNNNMFGAWREGMPYCYYPANNGLIPWGRYPEGNDYTFYWKVNDCRWTIVVYNDCFEYIEYDMTMSEFLYNLLAGNIVLDNTFNNNNIAFVPFN